MQESIIVDNIKNITGDKIESNRVEYLYSFNFNFNLYIQVYQKLDEFKLDKYKNIINIFHKYEPNAINLKDSIYNTFNKKYSKFPKIISNDFFYIWELCNLLSGKTFIIYDNDCSTLQSIYYYRQNPQDKFYLLNEKNHINEVITKLVKIEKIEQPDVMILNNNKSIIFNIQLILKYKPNIVILKCEELFSLLMNKMMILLSLFYDEIIIQKPFTVPDYVNTFYIICKNYKSNKIKLPELNENITDFFTNYIFDQKYINNISNINGKLFSKFFLSINELYDYLKSNNYYTEQYDNYINNQKKYHQKWLDMFTK